MYCKTMENECDASATEVWVCEVALASRILDRTAGEVNDCHYLVPWARVPGPEPESRSRATAQQNCKGQSQPSAPTAARAGFASKPHSGTTRSGDTLFTPPTSSSVMPRLRPLRMPSMFFSVLARVSRDDSSAGDVGDVGKVRSPGLPAGELELAKVASDSELGFAVGSLGPSPLR